MGCMGYPILGWDVWNVPSLANAIFEGASNARGGERQFAAGRGLAESNLHLFEPVQLL